MPSITNHRLSVDHRLVTLREASRLSGITQRGLRLLMLDGCLHYLRLGGSIWLRREDVQRIP